MVRGSVSLPSIWLAVIAVFALSACTTIVRTESGRPIAKKAAGLSAGSSTLADVLGEMGPPGKVSAIPGGMALLYEYTLTSEKQLGIGFTIIFAAIGISPQDVGSGSLISFVLRPLEYFEIVQSRGKGQFTEIVFFFDDRKMLVGISKSHRNRGLGSTIAARIKIFPDKLLDTGKYHRPATQHKWGLALLQPLPRSLNRAQELNFGTHGLEQRGTPGGIGQRTLEWKRRPE